jgi:hypothetical protein
MEANRVKQISQLSQLISLTYEYIEREDTPEPSPEFKRAFDAKVQKFRDYVASR